MITIGGNTSATNSAYKQTQEKRDYISLVSNSLPGANENHSDGAADRFSDQDLIQSRSVNGSVHGYVQPQYQTLQPYDQPGDENEDAYPYAAN